ncbi:molybdopterin molybdotransferase MoeA [Azospirillum sp. SYSU D00513]|uniref:molybdopterin molybdotransferase MoeA n=1 Tax=Azospirillum sp. SYSU D00513 TaxID=2812561 RepID=UPI001A9693B5|nr:molybdopterin molybdotransferase MoeA [Azospirillum sp. SYSU D00513]
MAAGSVTNGRPEPRPDMRDVRGRGFATRASLAEAEAWIDARVPAQAIETVPFAGAVGRVSAAALAAPGDWPPAGRAARDGMAVAASDTLGAGSYNPVPLFAAVPVAAGDPLPAGADSVLPVEAVQEIAGMAEALAALAPGEGVERRGESVRAGAPLLAEGEVLRPHHLGLLAALGVAEVAVRPRPRVRIVLAGGPRRGADALGAMLVALVARDGGLPELVGPLPADVGALAAAFAEPGADLLLSAGRTGVGPDDVAPLALAAAGTLALHGVAMRPGDSAGLGLAGAAPAVLLPGEPMACLAAYELLGGRAVRRLGGRAPEMPLPVQPGVTRRKLVSEIGCADLYRVRIDGEGGVEPVASPAVPGLGALLRADGFVLIPPESEGVPEGSPVTVRRYDATMAG